MPLNVFDYNISRFFEPQTLVSMIRILALIFIGLPTLYAISRWLRKYFLKKFTAQQAMLFSKLVLYSGALIILFSVLNELGFKLTHLLGAAGIVGVAVGFASQTSVSNIICGLFLITEKPFEVDDVITVGGNTGVVLSIDILSVKLRTFDNKMIRIPNETIIKSDVTNVTYFPIRRVDINVGVAYKENIGRVREVLLDVAHHNPLCLNEPEPLVVFSGFGESSIDFSLLVWAVKADWLSLKNSITEEIKNRFDEENIEIPFPHLSIYSGSATSPIPVNLIKDKNTDTI